MDNYVPPNNANATDVIYAIVPLTYVTRKLVVKNFSCDDTNNLF